MAFWSAETMRIRVPGESLVLPYDPNRVKYGAYELSVGAEIVISDAAPQKEVIEQGATISIPAGQFAALITAEIVEIPPDSLALISIKATRKFLGLVNVSGFHVDPGFKGKLKFSVYNAGPEAIALMEGEPLFLLWYASLDRTTKEVYDGGHQNQKSLTADDVQRLTGEVASPAALDDRLTSVERTLDHWRTGVQTLFLVIAIPLLIALAQIAVDRNWDRWFPSFGGEKTGYTPGAGQGSPTNGLQAPAASSSGGCARTGHVPDKLPHSGQ